MAILNVSEAYTILKPVLLFVIGMAVYSIFIFKFYRFIARKNVFELDLGKYSHSEHKFIKKTTDTFFFIIKYILLFPVLVFFWFMVLAVLLAFLARDPVMSNILLVSIALVSVVRVTAYYDEELSRDLAKMLPLALLGVFLIDISYFSFSESMTVLQKAPEALSTIAYYLLFVIALEFVLRVISIFLSLFSKRKIEE